MLWQQIENSMLIHSYSRISDDNTSYSYKDFLSIVDKKVIELAQILPKHSKCCILCSEQIFAAMAILCCWKLDCVVVPMSLQYGKLHCEKIIELINPDLIITNSTDFEFLSRFDIRIYDICNNKITKTSSYVIKQEDVLVDVAAILCTSGTTGSPKGALISQDSILENALCITQYLLINDKDTILIDRPLYHCAVLTGEFLVSILKGTNIYFSSTAGDTFKLVKLLCKDNPAITVLGTTPSILHSISKIVKNKNLKLYLTNITVSGERLTNAVGKEIKVAFSTAKIYNVYGLTEASPRVTFLSPDMFDTNFESVGKPLSWAKLKIVDADEQVLSDGEVGVLYVSGKCIMKGYYKNEQLTTKVIINKWLNTGDVAKIENGNLYILSRYDSMIIRHGVNIYPEEIESMLKSQVEIKEVLAYKIANNISDEIGIKLTLSDDFQNLSKVEILRICTSCLPKYMWPSKLEIVDFIPKNATGKTIRITR